MSEEKQTKLYEKTMTSAMQKCWKMRSFTKKTMRTLWRRNH